MCSYSIVPIEALMETTQALLSISEKSYASGDAYASKTKASAGEPQKLSFGRCKLVGQTAYCLPNSDRANYHSAAQRRL